MVMFNGYLSLPEGDWILGNHFPVKRRELLGMNGIQRDVQSENVPFRVYSPFPDKPESIVSLVTSQKNMKKTMRKPPCVLGFGKNYLCFF